MLLQARGQIGGGRALQCCNAVTCAGNQGRAIDTAVQHGHACIRCLLHPLIFRQAQPNGDKACSTPARCVIVFRD